MPIWPLSLPADPLIAGYSVAPQKNVVAFGTEVGPGKVRRRSTARVKTISNDTYLQAGQLAVFLSFFEDELQDGALTFTWTNQLDGLTASFRFAPDSPYQLSAMGGGLWRVTMNLMLAP